MAASPWPPRPDVSEQRARSFLSRTDRASVRALREVLATAVEERRVGGADPSAASRSDREVTLADLRAALTRGLDERNEGIR